MLFQTKQKAYHTYIAPRTAAAAVLFRTDRAGVQPIGRRLSVRPRTLVCDQTAIRSRTLPFDVLHPVITLSTAHLPTLDGWKAELAWFRLIG